MKPLFILLLISFITGCSENYNEIDHQQAIIDCELNGGIKFIIVRHTLLSNLTVCNNKMTRKRPRTVIK